MPRIVRCFAALLFALLLFGEALPCHAAAPEVSASAYVLMDADGGRVLLARSETSELPIASTTKIMTALVALRHSDPTDVVTVKREHLREGSSMYLTEGETLTMEALLYGLMLPSGNDAAECIADYCGGGTDRFVRWMNETAAELGMTHTAFVNPSGLDAAGHYSCAMDMARLMAEAMREPLFAQIASTSVAAVGTRTMGNHNKLLGVLEGCVAGKTGYTGGAGRTLVTCAERDGLRLIAVTLNDGNDWLDHTALYEYGFSTYRSVCALSRGEVCALSAVRGGEDVCVPLCAVQSCWYPLAGGEELRVRIEAAENVPAPVKAGQQLGEAVVLLDGGEVARVPLVASKSVKKPETAAKPTLLERLRVLFGTRR